MKALNALLMKSKDKAPKGLMVAEDSKDKAKMGGLKDEDVLKKLLGDHGPSMGSAAEPVLDEENDDDDKVLAVLAKLLKIK